MRDRAYGNNLYVLFSLPFLKKWLKNYWHFVTGPTKSFQLTSSQGGWRLLWRLVAKCSQFQLTSSRGGWRNAKNSSKPVWTFQLTSSRGGWQFSIEIDESRMRFQLTSSRGGWPTDKRNYSSRKYFNSHPHEEDDTPTYLWPDPYVLFQLTSSRGGWLKGYYTAGYSFIFQLTSSRGGWPPN